MRNSVIAQLEKLAEIDENIYLLTGDLGFGVLDNFAITYPNRFINAGISEQNMTAVAAGMALENNTVYTYSIGNFPTLRCLEQIRNDICYHNANVKIIVVGGGFAYGQLGMSHHATEDIAIMRALPNMKVFSPADPDEAVEVIKYVNSIQGPCYIRLGKGREPRIHADYGNYSVHKVMELYKGDKIAIISTGSVLGEAKKAVEELKSYDINVGLYNVISIKPLDEDSIKNIAKQYETIISLEEHNNIGGLGGAISEVLSGMSSNKAVLVRMGLEDVYTSIVGSQDFLREYYGLSASAIKEKIKDYL
ncbi:MAG: transketolase [Lachnospiraceae bacterium]|nr:transketolase [Lachnospiraceae bacterium]